MCLSICYLSYFFVLNKETYEKGLEKLVAAQDTSNIENDISSNELREKKKQKRRINAKRHFSSSSDEENKENRQKKKQLPALPHLQDFISSTPIINKIMENFENEGRSHEGTFANKTNNVNRNGSK